MAINLKKLEQISGTTVEETDEWSIGRKKTLEAMKLDWIKLIKGEIKKVANDKSRMVRWSNDSWKIRLVRSTVAIKFFDKMTLSIGDTRNSKEMITKVLVGIQEEIKAGNMNKEIQQHMDTCRVNRKKYQ